MIGGGCPAIDPLLEARGICRRSRSGDWLLHDVSLTLDVGDRLALGGEAGAGKTLLLRALAKLDACDGEILWRGAEVRRSDVPRFRSQVVYLQQRPALREGSVDSILREPFEWATHRQRKYQQARVVGMLERLGRDASFLQKRHDDLSGGERAIVALLRAIQLEPIVLLLDEPTSALDPPTARTVETLVHAWLAEGDRGLIWVSHDPDQTTRVANRSLRLQQGRVVS